MNKYYLRPNAVAEPLINRWYAWPMLISPAAASLITLNLHFNIMQSYIRMPKIHMDAVKNANMRGGPFIDFGGENKVAEVKQQVAEQQSSCAPMLEFASALKELNQLLNQEGDGHSLIPLYEKIPPALRGYVELVYDTNNNPGFRLLESLLYRSPYYNKKGQELMLSLVYSDSRPFVLSTPRLAQNNQLNWKIPFADKALDTFFASREHGLSLTELQQFYKNNFEDTEENYKLFMSLFTEQAPNSPASYKKFNGKGVRIRYFGHACVLIESAYGNILIDAMISYGYKTDLPRYTFDDLPEQIDYVLLTHAHQDHVLFEHLLQLRYKIKNIVVPKNIPGAIQDPSLKLMFQNLNFQNVIEIDELESIKLPDGEIIGIPFFGEHGDLNIQSKIAYAIRIQDYNLLFAADSNNFEPHLYQHIQREIPKFDVIFLGMECDGAPMTWLYEPVLGKPLTRTMDQSRRLNGSDCDKAMDIIRRFSCSQVYIYAMGQEPWLSYITSIEYDKESRPITESDCLIKLCQAENRSAERVYAKKEIHLK
jgi:L-ascorbate metabolism protein UlaG (beta-lactamase superfamily)